MALTTQPVVFAGALQIPADPTLPPDPIPFNFSGTYVALSEQFFNIAGAGTTTIPFGSVITPGAKGIAIRYDAAQPQGAAPVNLALNGSSTPIELTPGSLFIYFDASPVSGITSGSLTATAACQIRVWILG